MIEYDEEYMIDDIVTLFKAQLNTEIDAINSQKGAVSGDVLFLPPIPTDKYTFNSLNKSLLNYKGFFVLYGITDTPIRDAQTDNYIEDLTINIEIATFDRGAKDLNNLFKQLLRYRKALKSVIMKNTDVFRGYAKPLVKSLKPDAFPYDRNVVILSIGLEIKASVTAN